MTQLTKSLCLTLLFIGTILTAQEFHGFAEYQSKMKTDAAMEKRLNDSNMPPERLARIKERIKQAGERIFELHFNREASIYKEQVKLEAGNNSRGGMFAMMSGGNSNTYVNTKTKQYVKDPESFGKKFLISDELVELDWILAKESRKIGNYLCFKATAVKTVPNVQGFRMFGRGKDADSKDKKEKEEQPTTKEITVTAWYTPEIPANHGPDMYWGLPGLILELGTDNMQLVCTKLVLNPNKSIKIVAPKKGKKINQEKYDAVIADKMKEMAARFKNNRSKGGRGHRMH